MRERFYTIVTMVGLLFFGACHNPQPGAAVLLEQAEQLVEAYPDSAMRFIDSIFYPEKSLNHENYMRFLVLQVQAKYKTYRPIQEDTLIFQARDYFSAKNKDSRITALAWYYSGCVYREREEYTEAMKLYKEAEMYAEQTGDTDLVGFVQYNMGDLFHLQGLYEKALGCYTAAESFYTRSHEKSYEKQARCLSAIGRMHMLLRQSDSAFVYFHRGLEIAETVGDNELLSRLLQNLSVAYSGTGQFDKAQAYLWQSYKLNTDSTEIPRYYLNFADLYDNLQQPDSARWYTEQLKQYVEIAEDDYFKISTYSYLAGWEKEQGNYDAALAYQDNRFRTLSRIMDKRVNQSVYEAYRKYDYEQMKKQHYLDLSVRQQWIILLLIMVMVGGTTFTRYWARQRNMKMETQQKVDTLQAMYNEMENTKSQKRLDLRKDLLWRFDVAKKLIEINAEFNKPGSSMFDKKHWIGQFNKIVYGSEDIEKIWDSLFETFNEGRPGLAEKIKEKYPELTEVEFRICILVYAGFNVNETSLILKLSSNTVQSRRSSARRKMGIDTRGDIATHIDQLQD